MPSADCQQLFALETVVLNKRMMHFGETAAQIQDDGVMYRAGASEELRNTAKKLGYEPPVIASNKASRDSDSIDGSMPGSHNRAISREPAFPP